MKLVTLLGLAGALAIVVAGCGDDGRGTTDGGIVLMDSGTGDSGIVLMDSGSGGDTSTPPTDGGGGTCPPQTFPAPDMPTCAAATQTCAMSATSQAMLEACLAADPNAMDCEDCLNEATTSCATMNGCDDEFGQIFCCAEDMGCTTDNAATCIPANCGTEVSTFQSCGAGVGTACGGPQAFALCTIAG
ncbi:MAG: hypothetical protein JRH11_05505 [Deltaproteobacteria bacterium]|nr:hypothetical protein [Deltaproteobacteria bacterium]